MRQEQNLTQFVQVGLLLDRNGNLAGTFLPDAGDTVSIPNSNVSVDATGTTEVSLPLLVDL